MENEREKIPRSLGTHDGSFHADEVTAAALLVVFGLVDKDKIIRSREPNVLTLREYVCDVGGIFDPLQKFFDHHQADYRGEFSSAGMILEHLYRSKVIDEKKYRFLNRSFVSGVDAHDNGKDLFLPGVATYSHIISNFNPIVQNASKETQDKAFFEALDFAIGHLRRLNERYDYTRENEKKIKQEMEKNSTYLLFEESIPWQEAFFENGGEKHPALFVIMPAGEHWKLRGIPPSLEKKMEVRSPLPLDWAGLLDQELKEKTGIKGAVFCHKGRFISVWETKEDAFLAMEKILERKGEKG